MKTRDQTLAMVPLRVVSLSGGKKKGGGKGRVNIFLKDGRAI